jgi:hypothetical protein
MATTPNNKKLIVPHKTMPRIKQPEYGQDMRQIEMWANALPSAGSTGSFHFQSDSISTGNIAAWGSGAVGFTGTTTPQGNFPVFGGRPGLAPGSFVSGTIVDYVGGGGGYVYTSPGAGVKTLFGAATFQAPTFTGPSATVGAELVVSAIEMNGVSPAANAFHVISHQINLATGASHILTGSDYAAATIVGTDLAFASGALTCGNAGGTAPPYLVGWSVILIYDTANTYSS